MHHHELCTWCQENVFDEHTLNIIYPGDSSKSYGSALDSAKPFKESVDIVAYYSNRNFVTGYNRNLRQKMDLMNQNAVSGCIFCKLLKNVVDHHLTSPGKRSGQDHDKQSTSEDLSKINRNFDFVLDIKHPWQWSSVTIGTDHTDTSPHAAFFRLYPLNNRIESSSNSRSRVEIDPRYDGCVNDTRSWIQTLKEDGMTLRTLVEECQAAHPKCKPHDVSHLPSLLLKVSGSIILPSVRLLRASDITVHPIHYVCLSYCWGGPQPTMTTTSRLDSYLKRIDATKLPKTILDAVRVTISMGYEYLWVDAFCIVQDGGHLKNMELSKMSSIYSGAVCTICAMSVETATDGIWLSQDELKGTWHVDICDAKKHKAAILELRNDFSEQDLWESSLVKRAWTYQEALLSTRLVMFFSHGQRPVMRCSNGTVRSDGGRIYQIPKPLVCLEEIICNLEKERRSYGSYGSIDKCEEWVTIVKQYKRRSLTFYEDTMPALIGIVSVWERRLRPGRYCAGLWSETLDVDLLWRVPRRLSPRASHKSYIAPSWSWASRNHPIEYQSMAEVVGPSIIQVIRCDITPVYEDLPYGAVKAGRLTIECAAKLGKVMDPESEDSSTDVSVQDIIVEFIFDDSPRPRDINEIWLLYINDEEPYNNSHPLGLGVVEVNNADGDDAKLFRRIGMFFSHPWVKWPNRQFTLV